MSTAPNSNNIFIHAISQRCGHNFLSRLIKHQSNYNVFIHDNHEVVFPEFLSNKYETIKNSKNFIRNKKAKLKEIELAAESFINQSISTIFKSSRFTSSYEVDLFPGIKHLILVRHPMDLFVSYEKSIYNFRIQSPKNRIKKFIRPIYSYYTLKIWRKQINEALNFIDKTKTPYKLFRYEELHTIEGQKNLFNYLNFEFEETKPIKLENFNSSFASKEDIWKNHSDKIGNPIERFQNAPLWLKFIAKHELKNICKKLSYEYI